MLPKKKFIYNYILGAAHCVEDTSELAKSKRIYSRGQFNDEFGPPIHSSSYWRFKRAAVTNGKFSIHNY